MRSSVVIGCLALLSLAVLVASTLEHDSAALAAPSKSRKDVKAVKIKLPKALKGAQSKLRKYYKGYRARIDKRASHYYKKVQKVADKLPSQRAREKFVKENVDALKRWRNKQQKRLNRFVKKKAREVRRKWKRYVKAKAKKQPKSKGRESELHSASKVLRELKRAQHIDRLLTRSMAKHHRHFHHHSKKFEKKLHQRVRAHLSRSSTKSTTTKQQRASSRVALRSWWRSSARAASSSKRTTKGSASASSSSSWRNANGTAKSNATNSTDVKVLRPALISRCVRVVQQQMCCQPNNVQPCCKRDPNGRLIPPSNTDRPRWTAQTAKWFRPDRPCKSHACRMRFKRHHRVLAATSQLEEEDEREDEDEDSDNELSSQEDVAEESSMEDESADDEESEGSFIELNEQQRAEVQGCVKVVRFCSSTPSCAAQLPVNMVTWLQRPRPSNVKADKVDLNAKPQRTPSAWNYAKGGAEWKDLCATGKMQSPIAIEENHLNLTTGPGDWQGNQYQLRFFYQPIMNLTITHHHGYAISVKPNIAGALGYLTSGCCTDARFHVVGFHFHVKSEHTFPTRFKDDGSHYPMELHIMHQKEGSKGNDDLLIVTVPFQLKRTPGNNRFLDALNWNSLPKNIGDSAVLSSVVNLHDLDSSLNGDYFVYNGSLASPGCPENVQYRVMSQPQSLPQSQLDRITAIIRDNSKEFPGGHGNYREVQPRNGRAVVLYKRHQIDQAFYPQNRHFVWVRTERPSPGAVLKVN